MAFSFLLLFFFPSLLILSIIYSPQSFVLFLSPLSFMPGLVILVSHRRCGVQRSDASDRLIMPLYRYHLLLPPSLLYTSCLRLQVAKFDDLNHDDDDDDDDL